MAKIVDKQQQVQDLLKQAEDGARAVFESDNYRNYLATMSKFHDYSFRNTLLIFMQKPEASYVAGYVAWQKNFKRQVQKGEKGIQIVGYTPKNVNQEQEKKDANGNTIIGADGKPETETVTRKIPYFTPVYVYDVSQTEGEPLPRLVNELDGSVEAYNDLMTALREVSPFPIVFEDIKGGANGYCSPLDQKIAIRQGMSEAQTIKTTIHEITHADLHAPEIDAALDERKDRRTKEVEAESTAFIVCNHYGIDTSDYSFAYLASWSSTKELSELQSSLDTIQKQANELIDRIDNRLSELQKDRPLEQENAAVSEKPVSIEEMQQYGYTDKGMLPLDADLAKDLFTAGSPIYLLYSDNTKITAHTEQDIAEHIEKGGLFGITDADFHNARATELATRYDALIEASGIERVSFPFSIEDRTERIKVISDRVKNFEIAFLTEMVDDAIKAAPDNGTKNALQWTADKISEAYKEYITDRLSDFHGEPIVTVRWSENPMFKGGETYPLHEANAIFRRLDAEYPADMGYEKTAFTLIYEMNGEIDNYEGRQDFGDRDGGVIDHISAFWRSELSPSMLGQNLAAGNQEMIDGARKVVNVFVPYLETHNALGLLSDEAKTQLGAFSFMKSQGATMPDLDNIIKYYQAVETYVENARIALNTGSEMPQVPLRADYVPSPVNSKEAAQIESYKEEVKQQYTREAAALGITVDAYAQNEYTAPAERSFAIYQLNDTGREYRFESLDRFGQDQRPVLSMYDKVYEGTLPPSATLDSIYEEFNIARPADFTGHSLSMSDVIVIQYDGEITANYVDKYGFVNVPELAQEIEDLQQEKDIADFERYQENTKNLSERRLYQDPEAGIEAGINKDGELYFGDEKSGYNLPDTPENRRYIEADIKRYTGKDVSLGNQAQPEKPVLAAGDIFAFEGKTWEVEKNDGFLLTAKNLDKTDNNSSIMWIGSADKHDYKLISRNGENLSAEPQQPVFTYYTTQRPPDIGTFPKDNVISVDSFDKRTYIEAIGREAWGKVEYSKMLSDKDVKDYELAKGFTEYTHFYYDTKYLFTVTGDKEAQAVYDRLCSDVNHMGYFWSDSGKAYNSTSKEAPTSDRAGANRSITAYVPFTPQLYRQHINTLEKEYAEIKPDKPVQREHTVVNAEMLLAEAQKTPDYFKVQAAITGLPIDEKGYLSVAALMDKTRGTDAYDAINKIFDEQQRRENERLDSVKFDNDIDLDKERSREQLGFNDAAPAAAPLSAAAIFQAAREEAARINSDADRQRQAEQTQNKNFETERGE